MYFNCVYFKSRKHLSVPPGLGQRQQLLSLSFSVFFSKKCVLLKKEGDIIPQSYSAIFKYLLTDDEVTFLGGGGGLPTRSLLLCLDDA